MREKAKPSFLARLQLQNKQWMAANEEQEEEETLFQSGETSGRGIHLL